MTLESNDQTHKTENSQSVKFSVPDWQVHLTTCL